METVPDSKPGKPTLGRFLRCTFAALIFLGLWTISRIPTYHDKQKISHFRTALAHQLELTGLPDLDIKVSPRSRGRGNIFFETPVSPEKLNRIRREFDQLNVAGDYELKVLVP